MKLQILGSGCAKCKTLGQHATDAAQALGLEYELEKVTDINAIIDAGVMSTPALVVDGEIRSVGKVLSVEEIKTLLSA
ncbi:MAG: TM0996/MTH895 family glutaredoxin-like protein [Candidatus Competibacteraceae bacterium]|nr:MAG: TM0996/MTH895 family glutaredoxin-like protein [Candidatus Competibacteraceae bacterium]